MPVIVQEAQINVPQELCFDLARSVDIHLITASHTQEKSVGGRTTGLLEFGDSITFEGVHFGIRQRLSARIVRFERPRIFADEMTQGAFQSLCHTHEFFPNATGTLMRDTLEFVSPFGLLGKLADRLFVINHMTQFLFIRNAELKKIAESGEWRNFLAIE